MCDRHKRALAVAERTVMALKRNTDLWDGVNITPDVRAFSAPDMLMRRMADQYARDAELLDTWLYIRDLLRKEM